MKVKSILHDYFDEFWVNRSMKFLLESNKTINNFLETHFLIILTLFCDWWLWKTSSLDSVRIRQTVRQPSFSGICRRVATPDRREKTLFNLRRKRKNDLLTRARFVIRRLFVNWKREKATGTWLKCWHSSINVSSWRSLRWKRQTSSNCSTIVRLFVVLLTKNFDHLKSNRFSFELNRVVESELVSVQLSQYGRYKMIKQNCSIESKIESVNRPTVLIQDNQHRQSDLVRRRILFFSSFFFVCQNESFVYN